MNRRVDGRAGAANGGWVNFDIGTVAPGMGKTMTTGISRRLVSGSWQAPAADTTAGSEDVLRSLNSR